MGNGAGGGAGGKVTGRAGGGKEMVGEVDDWALACSDST